MSPATDTSTQTGQRVELGHYRTRGGERRILFGQRVLGVVRVVDAPDDGHGRRYVVERELTSQAELDAILADYLGQAHALGQCPMQTP